MSLEVARGDLADLDLGPVAVAVVERTRLQVVVLDLMLSPSGETDGLDVCAELSARWPEIAVLVFTTFLDQGLVLEAIHRGARGYVVKAVDTSGLITAIRDLARGESAFDGRSAAAMMRGLTAMQTDDQTKLTPRQVPRRQPDAKLDVSRRTEAASKATRQGLI